MLRKALVPLFFAAMVAAAPAVADEVVYFTNGTTMVIESHEIDGDTVRVNLGGQGLMAFPLEQVERIQTNAGAVRMRGAGATPNQRVGGSSNAVPITGHVPSRHRRDSWDPSRDGSATDKNSDPSGVAIFRPFGSNSTPNKRQFGLSGRRELQGGESRTGVAGASRIGQRYVVQGKTDGPAQKPIAIGKGSQPPPKKKAQ
jgi:hypothetical protein